MDKSLLAKIKLDKVSAQPLYYQLKSELLDLIASGDLAIGDKMPSETMISDVLKISRPTVRQALQILVEEGHLRRIRGKGSYISKPKVRDCFLAKIASFNQDMRLKGLKPKTDVLALGRISAIFEINQKLDLALDEDLIYLARLRYTDEQPVVYVETYLPYNLFSSLLKADFVNHSLYDLMLKEQGIKVDYAEREIEAVTVDKHEAKYLGITVNHPVCLVRSLIFAENSQIPVEYSVARYRGDKTKFFVETYR